MTSKVERKNILITGASSGLGEGMARLFAAKGRNLAICARRTDRLEALAEELRAQYPGIKVAVRALDVNDYDAVFRVFKEFDEELGGIDRVIANAGMGKGAPLGTGKFKANLQTAQTNFLGLLAQCEAAMEIFLARKNGHLVVISSISAVRGFAGPMTVYAATKAAARSLAEGIRLQNYNKPISVTTLMPGYIESEMTGKADSTKFMVSAEEGCKALVDAIEKEPDEAIVPAWPWIPMTKAMAVAPISVLKKMM
ncbi:MAG: SDR family oxidoreductase [Nocardiaceae bacterium]|nr:SDR family oxidoreductase [Nocardiaceae bacterium]